jgi:hypothetical protein
MGRPSIFSNDYEQRMRRRKINAILAILVIASGAFFGVKYYLNKNNISFFKMNKPPITNGEKEQSGKSENQNKAVTPPVKNNESTSNNTLPQEQASQFLSYTTSDGKVYKIEYTVNNGVKEITALKGDLSNIFFNISTDKKKIVFEEQSTGHIISGDTEGSFKKISRDNYVTKSTGKTLTKQTIINANPWFIWSVKPNFTPEGKVVYISHLPYIKVNGDLYLWIANPDGTGHAKIGAVGKDIKAISYGGIDPNGRLIIKSGSLTYYFSSQNNRLSK